ncbi:MAG: ATP synthase F1 subunit delta [Dethiobacteria bacterium]
MKDKRTARRYAEALFYAAQKQGHEEEIGKGLASMKDILEEYAELQKILISSLLSPQEKEQALQALLPRVLSIKKEEIVTSIAAEYQHLLDQAKDVEAVEVKVAAPLSPALELELKNRLTRLIGKKVRLEMKMEPEMLGGLTLRWGDRVVDASVRKKLELLGAHLKKDLHPVN